MARESPVKISPSDRSWGCQAGHLPGCHCSLQGRGPTAKLSLSQLLPCRVRREYQELRGTVQRLRKDGASTGRCLPCSRHTQGAAFRGALYFFRAIVNSPVCVVIYVFIMDLWPLTYSNSSRRDSTKVTKQFFE